jgi:hypothetical protein
MMATESGMYRAHVGKSLYIHQMVQLLTGVHKRQVYVMVLENFVQSPVDELEMFFKWLGLPLYGEFGFESAGMIRNMSKQERNVHPIDQTRMTNEVIPMRDKLDAFYRPSIKLLHMLYAGDSSTRKLHPATGNWTDFAAMMRTRNSMLTSANHSHLHSIIT